MNTTTASSSTSKPFVEGLIDQILAELPFSVRIDLIFNWSSIFSTPGYRTDPAIVEIIGTITKLDFHGSLKVEQTFPKLTSLPFSSLRHINLSESSFGQSTACVDALRHPVFQHLETLELQDTKLKNLNPLLDAPHPFPNLHTLNLSSNDDLYIPTIATTTKFPNLKVLDIRGIKLDSPTIEAFAAVTTTPSPIIRAPFQLDKLSIRCSSNHLQTLNTKSLATSLSRSPHLTQLSELAMPESSLTMNMISELFDPNTSVLKILTHLQLGGLDIEDGDYSPLAAVAQSPLLSNLVQLELGCDCLEDDPAKAETNKQYLQRFLSSPFLWTPRLKHLTLKNMPGEFVFDDLIPALNTANIKLQTLHLNGTQSSINALSTASCLSELEELRINALVDLHVDQQEVIEAFIQSPILSKFKVLPLGIIGEMTCDQLVSLLSSPNMSNDLIEIELFVNYEGPLNDAIKTLCTQRIIPGDETSPLKFGKLRTLDLSQTTVSDDDIELIVGNLTQLVEINLDWTCNITDKTIGILLATERDDPCYPYTSLPNLTHLHLTGSPITQEGLDLFYQSLSSQQLDE